MAKGTGGSAAGEHGHFNTELRRTLLPPEIGTVVDLTPLHDGSRCTWLFLTDGGRLLRFDADVIEWKELATASVPAEPEHQPWCDHVLRPRLHLSASGDFVAVVNDYGRFGQILDLRSGQVTLSLDGGDYFQNTVPFSFAFAEVGGRTVAIHRSDWNRLDLSDPATGELLTARQPTGYRGDEPCPEHYLDYFHGALHLNPSHTRVLDDGWVWHPVGVPACWSLHAWLFENRWESEDGASRMDLCARVYYWDHAALWLDDDRVALAGIGDDEQEMVPGARIFDVSSRGSPGGRWREDLRWAREHRAFAGPSGAIFSQGPHLFSSDRTGLSRWDPSSGERTGHLPGFQPSHHHRGTGELVCLVDRTLIRWSV